MFVSKVIAVIRKEDPDGKPQAKFTLRKTKITQGQTKKKKNQKDQ